MLLGIFISIIILLIPVFIAWKVSTIRREMEFFSSLDGDSYAGSMYDHMRAQVARDADGKSYIEIGGNMVEIDKETGRPICD